MIPFDAETTEGKPGGSSILDEIVDRIRETFLSIKKVVTNDHLVTVTVGTTPKQVFHGLGAPPLTWEIVGRDAAETVFEPAIVNGARMRFLYLQASGPVTVTVRFT